MKALVLKDKHRPVELVEISQPVAGPGEAIVRVEAAALNHRDVWIQKGQYAGLKYPIVPGSDGAGVVVEVGAGVGAVEANSGGAEADGGSGVGAAAADWVGKSVIINPALDWGGSMA